MLRRAVVRRSRWPLLLAFALVFYLIYTLYSAGPTQPPIRYIPSSFNWREFQQFHPVNATEIHSLPTGTPKHFPPIQADFSKVPDSGVQKRRRDAVRRAFEKSWTSYKKYAWGSDEVLPLTGGRVETYGGYAATLVDALDTLWIMGYKDEFRDAVRLVAGIDWMQTNDSSINVFEITIRHLGGLLGAYDLSGERTLLRKAIELGDMLLAAFDTPNRMPGFWLSFEDARMGAQTAGTNDPSASPTTLCLELTRLAQLTGDNRYYDAVYRVTLFLARTQDESRLPGMWPATINFRDERVQGSIFTLGALADSLYECFPKMHLLTGGLDPIYETLYRKTITAVHDNLLFRAMLPTAESLLFLGQSIVESAGDEPRLNAESEHLTCFAGGMFGLGGRLFNGLESHVKIGQQITNGCAWVYWAFPTGIMPEIFGLIPCPSLERCAWDDDKWHEHGDKSLHPGFTHAREPKYILRPEAMESLFVMWRITGKAEFRDAAWRMFQAIVRATETELAFSAIEDVTVHGTTTKTDNMQSFWMAETLKYLYLIFSDSGEISLDEYVFNTEAHPFRRPGKSRWFKHQGMGR